MGTVVYDTLREIAILNIRLIDEIPVDQRQVYIDNEVVNLDRKYRRMALKEVLMNKYKSYYTSLIDKGDSCELLPLLKEIQENQNEKFKSQFLFITINPKPTVNLIDFLKVCEKCCIKSWINKYCYVIEQRGETLEELGKGFHMHMLIDKGDYRFSHARREFVSTFNKYCDTSNIGCFNFASVKEEDLRKRQTYITGKKADETKHKKQEMDIPFRERYGIRSYYGEKFAEEILRDI